MDSIGNGEDRGCGRGYFLGVMLSPACSLIGGLFNHEEPKSITRETPIKDEWSAYLQSLEGHSDGVNSMAFKRDSTWLASTSYDRTIKIWDASSGKCLQTLMRRGGTNARKHT